MVTSYDDALAAYESAIAKTTGIERKGKTMPYTSANGHMFSQLNKDGEIGVRLPEGSYEAFLKKHKAAPFTSYGTVMKGYVRVPDKITKNAAALAALLEEGRDYVMSLKPKK
ncbi:MAG: hypothetical protein AAGC95_02610 [Pseudomonadota bacterium]